MKSRNVLLIGAGALAILWASRSQAAPRPSGNIVSDWLSFPELFPGADFPMDMPSPEDAAVIEEASDSIFTSWLPIEGFAPRTVEAAGRLTRGERNNNPGNIRRTNTRWKGMASDQSGDPSYIVFIAPEYGIRAMTRVLFTYYERYGLNTVRKIISRWAPPSENPTADYVQNVANALGVHPDDEIDVTDPGILWTMVDRIIVQENGRNIFDAEALAAGIGAAYA